MGNSTGPWRKNPEPTQEQLRALLDYDPETGIFTRKRTGKPSGCLNAYGYLHIGVGPYVYRAHRLAFIWMTGSCPDCIDHIDGARANNAWRNLREATRAQNNANRAVTPKGYTLYRGKWQARISVDSRTKHLGLFDTEAEAHAAYLSAASELRGEFARVA